MTLDVWIAFVFASLVLTMTPGPSIRIAMVHSMKFGARKTLATACGDISANFLQMLLVALGLGAVIAASAAAFQAIKWFGVIALLFMGIRLVLPQKQHKIPQQPNANIEQSSTPQ